MFLCLTVANTQDETVVDQSLTKTAKVVALSLLLQRFNIGAYILLLTPCVELKTFIDSISARFERFLECFQDFLGVFMVAVC